MNDRLQIDILGAAGTVTGSRSVLRFEDKYRLIDCGLFQGPRETRMKNWDPFPIEAARIDSILLTHAHLDHSGFVPKLFKEGFRGKIYCSQGTADLCEVLWLDSAKLQEEDAEYANRTGHSRHKPAYPLYKTPDAKGALKLLHPISEGQEFPLSPKLSVTLRNAGHIVGANFLEITAMVEQRTWSLCFSGDLGHDRSLTIRGPESPSPCDFLLLESTYGDRDHARGNGLDLLAKHIEETCSQGGVLLIPAFAVGRSQELLYMIRQAEDQKKIASYPIVLDSPMSQRATDIYLKNAQDHQLREDFQKIDRSSFFPKQFETCESPDDSFAACMRSGPMVVISAAGMLNGGRILHHLKSRLPIKGNKVLFVGHQGEGTKGRFLLESGKATGTLRVHHREIPVEAEIECLETLSAHGDRSDLSEWLGHMGSAPKLTLLNHGESNASQAFRKRLGEVHPDWRVEVAREGMKVQVSEKEISIKD